MHESHCSRFSKLVKQLMKVRGGMNELSKLAAASHADGHVFVVLVIPVSCR